MKKILFVLLAILMLTSVVACSQGTQNGASDNSLQAIKDKGKLVLGLDDSFPPMGFKDESGEIVGFDIDVAKEVCKRLGIELELQPIDWDTKELELNGGSIDCIWNGFSITEDRKKQVLFSTPYMENRQVIVVMDGSDIQTKANLAGKKVGTQTGSSGLDAIEADTAAKESFGELLQFKDYVLALTELKSGTVDAIVVDEPVGRYYIKKDPSNKYKVLDEDFGSEEFGIGFRMADKALCQAINEQIDAMMKDGTVKDISLKWLDKDITQ